MDKNEIIQRISFLRTRANLSAKALSEKIGKNSAYINSLETKKNFLPTLETLFDLIEACDSTVEEFFYHDITSYKTDKQILDLMTHAKQEKKEIILSILKLN